MSMVEAVDVDAHVGNSLFVDVAPRPVLVGLERLDHGMTGAVEVRSRVTIG